MKRLRKYIGYRRNFSGRAVLLSAATALVLYAAVAQAEPQKFDQSDLVPVINASGKSLAFDWPALRIGVGEYEEGPTGVTVFHFAKRSLVAVDVLGGGPGTVNTDYMDLGYDFAELDAIVFAGGSWYGLETVTAVASALKDDGIRDGNAFGGEPNIAMSVGSIIFDFGGRRLNEIYPDKRLAQATFRNAKTGEFPLGARGAGRFAMSGAFFGCNANSGQGGAFRQIGDVKIAAFVVANPYGVISDRDGNLLACHESDTWPVDIKVADLMKHFPESRDRAWRGTPPVAGTSKNTTISLVVTNQKLAPADLKRLAAQVHTSMARAIQPFATQYDGDVLYAVSTAELEEQVFSSPDLGVLASEVMWDALLSSVPSQPVAPAAPAQGVILSPALADRFAGDYKFSAFVSLRISSKGGKLYARATGDRRAYSISRDASVELQPVSDGIYTIPGRYPLTLDFSEPDRLVLNPGAWAQSGVRIE